MLVRSKKTHLYVPGIVLFFYPPRRGRKRTLRAPSSLAIRFHKCEKRKFLRLTLFRYEYTLGDDDDELAAVEPHGNSVETSAYHEMELAAAGVA